MATKFGVNLPPQTLSTTTSISPPLLLQQAYPVLCSLCQECAEVGA